jgi:polysaccharide biosynthesis transport protein
LASPLRGDGKSALAVWLAQTAQQAGLRVCIVDADLRRPSQHLLFGIGNAKGLADYLSGVTGVGTLAYDRHDSGIHLITNRAMPHSAIGLLSSPRLELLLRTLREDYDLVLIDTPSCLGLSDAAIIAPLCDQVLMLARADTATYAHLNAALLPMQYDGATPISLVVTHIRPHHLYENAVFQGAAVYG